MVVFNAHLWSKAGQGHSMSTAFINLEDNTLYIDMFPSSASLRKIQLKLMMLCSKQGYL